eukprot:CAMPEP_0178759788 /NCGR_PEP_ID=MMETSP0744-20121128/15132_1 /TAXON_ID=913974 /ORGANISM="Nitzschia punctata, Strain CCMP561" /LENGTH=169 /DNA_ID=CAMNT_0020414295 /DNA_START=62 /DNA_END=571 /DNA_ORIENTATION=-
MRHSSKSISTLHRLKQHLRLHLEGRQDETKTEEDQHFQGVSCSRSCQTLEQATSPIDVQSVTTSLPESESDQQDSDIFTPLSPEGEDESQLIEFFQMHGLSCLFDEGLNRQTKPSKIINEGSSISNQKSSDQIQDHPSRKRERAMEFPQGRKRVRLEIAAQVNEEPTAE